SNDPPGPPLLSRPAAQRPWGGRLLPVTLRFEQPEWLLLILLAIPIALIAWRWMVAMSPARRWTVVAARILLIALIAGMLSGATAVRRTDRIAVIALIDISGSVQRFADVGRTPD